MDTALKIYIGITLTIAALVGWTAYTFVTKAMSQAQAFNVMR